MRKEGWEKNLNDYFDSIKNVPFEWGKCDCVIFSSDAVKIITGIDPMAKKKKKDPKGVRGAYKTEDEARALIRKYRKSIRDIMDVCFDRKDVNFAKRGDVVYYKHAFGIVAGRGVAFFKSQDLGLEIVKLSDCVVAWDI